MAKFTIEEVLENIKTKFTNNEGKTSLKLSDRTVKETLESLLPIAGEEMELTDFVDNYCFKTVDSMNRNYIKDTTDFTKTYQPPKPQEPSPKPAPTPQPQAQPFDMAEFMKQFNETQKAALETALGPLNQKIAQLEQENMLKARASVLSSKRAALNFSDKQLQVFDQAMQFVQRDFGSDATADQIHDAAYKKFHELAEVFGVNTKPIESSQTGGGVSTGFKDLVEAANKSQESGQSSVKAALGLNNQ